MKRLFPLLLLTAAAFAQSFVGSITAFKPEDAVVIVKPDKSDAINVSLTPETIFKRIAPGESSLKNATDMKMTDMALGDKVLVSLKPGTFQATRVVVMPASDITKRNEADSLDWNKRGISGVVAAKVGNTITLKKGGIITVDDKTSYRRYNSDSVKFADAKVSKLDEINVGDQVRARGAKSEDGLKVNAEDIVFGTFVTKAGTITAINSDTKEVTVSEIGTNKPLIIKLTADSQIKRMPDMAGRGAAPVPGRMPDLAQMLEHMPGAKLDDLKAGEKIVVSSTKGQKPDEITAIMLLGNADMLIQMATVPSGRGGGAAGGMGMGGGLQTLDLPSMILN
ncbi:MAG: DUF5666 domain-containing protein [Bryobacteraceae bacterium]